MRRSGACSASVPSACGSSARAEVCTNVTRTCPRGCAAEARELGEDRLVRRERLLGVLRQPPPRGRELHVAPDAAQQLHPHLPLELGQLHRDRGRAVVERVRHRGERPAPRELEQQPQAPELHQGTAAGRISAEPATWPPAATTMCAAVAASCAGPHASRAGRLAGGARAVEPGPARATGAARATCRAVAPPRRHAAAPPAAAPPPAAPPPAAPPPP